METTADQFERGFRRIWRTLALRGVLAVVFGVVLLIDPDISLRALVLTFGAFVAAHGVLGAVSALRGFMPRPQRFALLLQSAISIGFGVVAFLYTDMTELALLYVIGAWAIAFGVVETLLSTRLPAQRSTRLLVGLNGVLSIVFGVVMFWRPGTGALALIALIAAFAITTGTVMIAYAYELRGAGKELGRRLTTEPVAQS